MRCLVFTERLFVDWSRFLQNYEYVLKSVVISRTVVQLTRYSGVSSKSPRSRNFDIKLTMMATIGIETRVLYFYQSL